MDDDKLAHYLEKRIEALVMEITELEADVREKRNMLTRAQTALRAFKPETEIRGLPAEIAVKAVKPRKRRKPELPEVRIRADIFKSGELPWMVADVLRRAKEALSVRQITETVIRMKGIDGLKEIRLQETEHQVSIYLRHLRELGEAESIALRADRAPVWRIIQPQLLQ